MTELMFALQISAIGISTVLAALAILIGVVYATRAVFPKGEDKNDETLAVISAAVGAYMQETAKPAPRVSKWSLAGRKELMKKRRT